MAWFALPRLADLGLPGGVVRFEADASASGDMQKVIAVLKLGGVVRLRSERKRRVGERYRAIRTCPDPSKIDIIARALSDSADDISNVAVNLGKSK